MAQLPFAAGMLLLGAESALAGLTLTSTTPEQIRHWQIWEHVTKSLLPGVWLFFSLTYARGNARSFLKRPRFLLVGAFSLSAVLAFVFRADLVLGVDEPNDQAILGWAGLLVHVLLLLGFIFTLVDLERTYRASVGVSRWRIKYMLLGLVALFVVRVYTSSQALVYNAVDFSLVGIEPAALLIAQVLIVRSFFRPGHFAADLYPSHAVLQGSITVILAGAYLLLVGVLAKLAALLGGASAFPLKAFVVLVSLVVLAILLQSDHVRMRMRRFVSRHFQRPQFDYRNTWQQFAAHATSASDAPALCRSVVKLIVDSFDLLSVTIWLVNERRDGLTLAASSSLSAAVASELPGDARAFAAVILQFQDRPEPFDLETASGPGIDAVKQWHPNEFSTGGHRICIPLIGRGELLGLITLGDRVGGALFTTQDLDIFKCVGDHVAASLLNAQLSERLLRMKEVESFQVMAAFFVHDLKNAASTLNLLLQNLPEHFHDPKFREDALRGCAKTVGHINGLIGRLTELRQELRVQPVRTDLNALIDRVASELPSTSSVQLTRTFGTLPLIDLDPEQIKKVLTNLLLNAREAILQAGTIRVSTSHESDRVTIAVADSGCGMSAEFIQKSLFRPFKTTKQRGLGIGMFQSKMIIEAHGGRIEVESVPDRGTTFRVALPVGAHQA